MVEKILFLMAKYFVIEKQITEKEIGIILIVASQNSFQMNIHSLVKLSIASSNPISSLPKFKRLTLK